MFLFFPSVQRSDKDQVRVRSDGQGSECSRIMPSLVFFSFANILMHKIGVLLLPEVEKLQPWNNSNIYPRDVRRIIAIWNYWPRTLHSQFSSLEGRPYINDESYIDPYLYEQYINKWLNEELRHVLLPILSFAYVYMMYKRDKCICHKSFAQNFCQGHTLNGCCAELASNFDAKVSLFTLSHPR